MKFTTNLTPPSAVPLLRVMATAFSNSPVRRLRATAGRQARSRLWGRCSRHRPSRLCTSNPRIMVQPVMSCASSRAAADRLPHSPVRKSKPKFGGGEALIFQELLHLNDVIMASIQLALLANVVDADEKRFLRSVGPRCQVEARSEIDRFGGRELRDWYAPGHVRNSMHCRSSAMITMITSSRRRTARLWESVQSFRGRAGNSELPCVKRFSLRIWRILSKSSVQVGLGFSVSASIMAFVQAPPAPPGPQSGGNPKELTSCTSAEVCSSRQPAACKSQARIRCSMFLKESCAIIGQEQAYR